MLLDVLGEKVHLLVAEILVLPLHLARQVHSACWIGGDAAVFEGERPAHLSVLDALPRQLLGHERYLCVNDMVCGWAGSLGATDGVNVIGGTGSMTYGDRHGRGARVGGSGELFGDEGSGYWIATRGLNAFTRMSDGRLPRTVLYDLIREQLGVRQDLEVIGLVLTNWQKSRIQIAALSSTIAGAAAAGDLVAAGILDDAGVELGRLVNSTRSHSVMKRGRVSRSPIRAAFSMRRPCSPVSGEGSVSRAAFTICGNRSSSRCGSSSLRREGVREPAISRRPRPASQTLDHALLLGLPDARRARPRRQWQSRRGRPRFRCRGSLRSFPSAGPLVSRAPGTAASCLARTALFAQLLGRRRYGAGIPLTGSRWGS